MFKSMPISDIKIRFLGKEFKYRMRDQFSVRGSHIWIKQEIIKYRNGNSGSSVIW